MEFDYQEVKIEAFDARAILKKVNYSSCEATSSLDVETEKIKML